MSTITVGAGEQYSTIAAAVATSRSGDTIAVDAGTYTNDFITISHNLVLTAVGGAVDLVATTAPPDGKGIIDAGGSGVSVAITGFDISGASVADGNGSGIRYEGGTLVLSNDTVHGNQDGLLAASDPAGSITIRNSSFYGNGSGDGYTHNIYVDSIASLTVEDSTVTGAIVGHDIKSRAASTTITGDTITDGTTGTASYEIDLPNGGVGVIENNIIEKGAKAQNPNVISYGEEGNVYANSSLTVTGNTILNEDPSSSATAVANDTGITATLRNNSIYGLTKLTSGPVAVIANTILASEPALSSLIASVTPATGSPATGTTATGTTPAATTPTDVTPTAATPPATTPTSTTTTDTTSAATSSDTTSAATSSDTTSAATATPTTPTDTTAATIPTTAKPTDTAAPATPTPAPAATDPTTIAAADPASTNVASTASDASNTAAITTSNTVGLSVTPTAFLSSGTGSSTDQGAALASTTNVPTATTATGLSEAYSTKFVPKGTPYPDPYRDSAAAVYAPAALNQQVTSGITPDGVVFTS